MQSGIKHNEKEQATNSSEVEAESTGAEIYLALAEIREIRNTLEEDRRKIHDVCLLEAVSQKKDEDDSSKEKYPPDTLSLIAANGWDDKRCFCFCLFVFIFQMCFLFGLGLTVYMKRVNHTLPKEATLIVRVTQFMIIVSYCIFVNDTLNDVIIAVEQFPMWSSFTKKKNSDTDDNKIMDDESERIDVDNTKQTIIDDSANLEADMNSINDKNRCSVMTTSSSLYFINDDIECGNDKTPDDNDDENDENVIEEKQMSKEDIKKRNNMIISCVLRFVVGVSAVAVTFFLALSSTDIVTIILNFPAISFISTLDQCGFELLKKGRFGKHLELEAKRIENLHIPKFMIRTDEKFKKKVYWSTISVIGVILYCELFVLMHYQKHGVIGKINKVQPIAT